MTKEKSQIEKDFDEVKDAVNAKLKEAATAIRDAQKIAKTKGLSLMRDGGESHDYRATASIGDTEDLECLEFDQIENAMDHAGWQTSSWYC
jgi:hypothetical protein